MVGKVSATPTISITALAKWAADLSCDLPKGGGIELQLQLHRGLTEAMRASAR